MKKGRGWHESLWFTVPSSKSMFGGQWEIWVGEEGLFHVVKRIEEDLWYLRCTELFERINCDLNQYGHALWWSFQLGYCCVINVFCVLLPQWMFESLMCVFLSLHIHTQSYIPVPFHLEFLLEKNFALQVQLTLSPTRMDQVSCAGSKKSIPGYGCACKHRKSSWMIVISLCFQIASPVWRNFPPGNSCKAAPATVAPFVPFPAETSSNFRIFWLY